MPKKIQLTILTKTKIGILSGGFSYLEYVGEFEDLYYIIRISSLGCFMGMGKNEILASFSIIRMTENYYNIEDFITKILLWEMPKDYMEFD